MPNVSLRPMRPKGVKRRWISVGLALSVVSAVGIGFGRRGPDLSAPGLGGKRMMRMVLAMGPNTRPIYHSLHVFEGAGGDTLDRLGASLRAQGFRHRAGAYPEWHRGTESVSPRQTANWITVNYNRPATSGEVFANWAEKRLGRR